ncbi:MAG: 16S rRNA (guanine(527)-N(7))-methyltransferase RsmG [Acidaminobacteraceae bacterium]
MNYNDIMVEGFKELEIELSKDKANKFEIYKKLIQEWNEKINLTAITEDNEMAIKHFIDSASCFKSEKLSGEISMIDVGTGAGFPGIPLKILNENIKLTLLDSLNKRINFLQNVAASLELDDIEFCHGRAEDFGQDPNYRECFDVCVSRAVANLAVLTEYCLPFIKIGGYFIAQKGPKKNEELQEAAKAIEVLGGEIESVLEVKIPFSDITHSIVLIRKVSETPKQYPRKAGKPTKKPIR